MSMGTVLVVRANQKDQENRPYGPLVSLFKKFIFNYPVLFAYFSIYKGVKGGDYDGTSNYSNV
jgi:hypothetical protein